MFLIIDREGYGPLQGKPTLRIGHHLLEGTIVSLAKPLAILQRVPTPRSPMPPPPQPDAIDVSMHCDDDDGGGGGGGGEGVGVPADSTVAGSYAIRTLVRKKIVFSKRPTPIVGASAKIGGASASPTMTGEGEKGGEKVSSTTKRKR